MGKIFSSSGADANGRQPSIRNDSPQGFDHVINVPVDGKNPVPLEVGSFFPLFTRVCTSQVVSQISSINSIMTIYGCFMSRDDCSTRIPQEGRLFPWGVALHWDT